MIPLLWDWAKYSPKHQRRPGTHCDPTHDAEYDPGAQERRDQQRHRQEHYHRRLEVTYWIITVILTTGAVGGAIYGVSIASNALKASRDQADAAQGQLNALRDEQRPWIKVMLQASALTWSPIIPSVGRIGNVIPAIILVNVGNSPAFDVRAAAWPYINGSKETLDVFQKRMCAFLTADPVGYGRIMFPKDQIDASKVSIGQIGFGIYDSQLVPGTFQILEGKKTFNFIMTGCADYAFGFPPAHHQTFFAYEAWHIVDTGKPPKSIGGFTVGEDVPVEDVMINPATGDNYAN
jgi:hypothetical protein